MNNNNNNINIEEDEIDIHKIVVHLKRNLSTILLVTFIVTSMAIAYAYFLKPVYSSSVTISFSDQKTSQLSAIIPDEFAGFGMKESELETVKLTLMTRTFINSVIANLNLEQRYFIEKNFRKNEVYTFKNLKVNIDIHDELYKAKKIEESTDESLDKVLYKKLFKKSNSLYGKFFEIQPIDDKTYLLKVEELEYQKIHKYGEKVEKEYFSIKVLKDTKVEKHSYFVQVSDKSLLADTILENMQVTILSDNVMKIVYNDSVAKRAKELVDAVAKNFIKYTLDKKTSEIGKTLKFLNKEISATKKHLQDKGDKLQVYQEESQVFMPMESSLKLQESVNKKEEEIKMLMLQADELKSFKRALKQNKLNTLSLLYSGINTSSIQSLIELFRADSLKLNEMKLQEENIEKALTSNSQLSLLIQNLNEQRTLLENLRFNFTAEHPQVIEATDKLNSIEREITNYIQTNIVKLEESKALTKHKILNNIIMTQNNIASKLNVLKQDLNEKSKLLHSLPEKDLTIQDLKRQFTLSENIYTFLLQKKMELEISKASTIANTEVIEDPIEAIKPIKPNKKLIVVVGFILGLILGILYTAIKALLDTKIRSALTVTELTDAPLYGVLPLKTNKRFFDEALRSIRTNLQFVLPQENRCTTILVSSTVASEGKTTVIAGLADVIAQTDKKVLIMDLDLRKPRLYKELKKSNKTGVTHYLVGDKNYQEFIQTVTNNLDFFAAGTVPPNPSELLMSSKLKELLDELMEEYDYILFDTPPIGSVIDANMLLKYSDIVLLVIKADYAEKSYLENFNRLRSEKNIKSAGIILNQVKLQKSDGYGYGYGYGYGVGKES